MIRCVLFDLDGTLIDTAPDMADALNRLRRERGLAALPFTDLRPFVSMGTRGLLRSGFGLNPEDADYTPLRDRFLEIYNQGLCRESRLFGGMDSVLAGIETRGMRWGVVTNKPGWLSEPLLAALGLERRACCIISGDSAARAKPHPDPLFLACRLSGLEPADCIYVGDSGRDIEAGQQAGMRTVAAAYGYIPTGDAATAWGADFIIEHPSVLLEWLAQQAASDAPAT